MQFLAMPCTSRILVMLPSGFLPFLSNGLFLVA